MNISAREAFASIQKCLMEELDVQGFKPAEPLEYENGRAIITKTEDVAYSLVYDETRKRFELRSTTLDVDGNPTEWRSLSLWLYDETDGTKSDIDSIANDFVDVVKGPQRVDFVMKKQKKQKGEDRNVDPVFFFNRLVNIFPEIKDDMNEERIMYGQIRYVKFTKEKVVPKVDDFAVKYAKSPAFDKLCTLFADMYKDGDLDLRSILSYTLLNNISETAYKNIQDNENTGADLSKDMGFTRKLIGKTIKPEKKKKEKRVVAKLGDK